VDAEEPGNAADVTKILVLPSLPVAEPFVRKSVTMLKEHGIDGIISFRSTAASTIISNASKSTRLRQVDTLR